MSLIKLDYYLSPNGSRRADFPRIFFLNHVESFIPLFEWSALLEKAHSHTLPKDNALRRTVSQDKVFWEILPLFLQLPSSKPEISTLSIRHTGAGLFCISGDTYSGFLLLFFILFLHQNFKRKSRLYKLLLILFIFVPAFEVKKTTACWVPTEIKMNFSLSAFLIDNPS